MQPLDRRHYYYCCYCVLSTQKTNNKWFGSTFLFCYLCVLFAFSPHFADNDFIICALFSADFHQVGDFSLCMFMVQIHTACNTHNVLIYCRCYTKSQGWRFFNTMYKQQRGKNDIRRPSSPSIFMKQKLCKFVFKLSMRRAIINEVDLGDWKEERIKLL